MSENLLNREQAGARLNRTGYWMVTQARAGKIPHLRNGRDYAWTEEQVEEIRRTMERRPVLPPPPALKANTPIRKLKAADSTTPALKANTPRRKRNAA